jgi:hypothetical protein
MVFLWNAGSDTIDYINTISFASPDITCSQERTGKVQFDYNFVSNLELAG